MPAPPPRRRPAVAAAAPPNASRPVLSNGAVVVCPSPVLRMTAAPSEGRRQRARRRGARHRSARLRRAARPHGRTAAGPAPAVLAVRPALSSASLRVRGPIVPSKDLPAVVRPYVARADSGAGADAAGVNHVGQGLLSSIRNRLCMERRAMRVSIWQAWSLEQTALSANGICKCLPSAPAFVEIDRNFMIASPVPQRVARDSQKQVYGNLLTGNRQDAARPAAAAHRPHPLCRGPLVKDCRLRAAGAKVDEA